MRCMARTSLMSMLARTFFSTSRSRRRGKAQRHEATPQRRPTRPGFAVQGQRLAVPPWREFVLGARVLHADGTPVNMLDPGAGRALMPCFLAYDFCVGRGAKDPMTLQGRSGTLVRDEFKGYAASARPSS